MLELDARRADRDLHPADRVDRDPRRLPGAAGRGCRLRPSGARRRSRRGSRARSPRGSRRRCRGRPACAAARAARPAGRATRARPRRARVLAIRPTYGTASRRAAVSTPLLVVAVRGDDHRGVVGARLRLLGGVELDRVPDPLAEVGQRARDRAAPRPRAGPARGRRGSRKISSAPPLRHGLLTVTSPSRASAASGVARAGCAAERLAGLQRPQRVQADGGLGAGAADEALDRAVAADDRGVAGPDARRPLGPDDRRLDEGRSLAESAPRPALPTRL